MGQHIDISYTPEVLSAEGHYLVFEGTAVNITCSFGLNINEANSTFTFHGINSMYGITCSYLKDPSTEVGYCDYVMTNDTMVLINHTFTFVIAQFNSSFHPTLYNCTIGNLEQNITSSTDELAIKSTQCKLIKYL